MADSQAVTVCRLAADDWPAYRAIRLAMLQESPWAFGGTYGEAAGYDEQLWRQRLTGNVVLLARVGTSPVGSVMCSEKCRVDSADPITCALFGMWVDPGFRRAGVGRALLDAVISRAWAGGRRRVVLNVVAGNDTAGRLYEGSGFVPTGRTFPYPHDDRVIEVEMELVLPLGADQGKE